MNRKELLDYLVTALQQGQVKSLGIYGNGVSGKTSFVQELCALLDEEQFNLLETDPYIIGDYQGSTSSKGNCLHSDRYTPECEIS